MYFENYKKFGSRPVEPTIWWLLITFICHKRVGECTFLPLLHCTATCNGLGYIWKTLSQTSLWNVNQSILGDRIQSLVRGTDLLLARKYKKEKKVCLLSTFYFSHRQIWTIWAIIRFTSNDTNYHGHFIFYRAATINRLIGKGSIHTKKKVQNVPRD